MTTSTLRTRATLRGLMVLFVGLLLATACQPVQAPDLAGNWEGRIDIGGVQAPITVRFHLTDAGLTGALDFPEQGLVDIPLTILTDSPPALVFTAFEGAGMATFAGERDGYDRIHGDFDQAGASGAFELARAAAIVVEPPPYVAEEVTFPSSEAVVLAGTLTLPFGPGPYPALALLTGAGPQTRDNELFGYRPFALLADHLTRHGYAVLRFDDRGVGASTGDLATATLDDLVADALAAVTYLQTRGEIDVERIGLLGHSEGALVAPLAATRSDAVGFVILLAAPVVPMDQIVLRQTELSLQEAGLSPDEIAAWLDLERRGQDAVRAGGDWAALEAEYTALRRSQLADLLGEAEDGPDLDALAAEMAAAWSAGYRSPGWRTLLEHDAAATLAQLTVPVLAIYGSLDTMTDPAQNVPALNDALNAGGVSYTLVSVAGANHGLQPAITGSVGEMPGLPKQFAPGVLAVISDWLATVP